MTFYHTVGDRLKFDVTVCPYCAVCEAQGSPKRSGGTGPTTIGRGGQICHFDIAVREKSP